MAVVLFGFIILAMAGESSASWCVCKAVSNDVLQKAIDYACGAGADCSPIRPNGQCFNPSNIKSQCSYAVNSYFQKKSAYGATCDFGGAATLTTSNPSDGTCSYPTVSSTAGPVTGTPTTTVPSTTPATPTTTPVTPVSGTGPGTGIGTGPGTGAPTGTTPAAGTTPVGGTTPTSTSPYSATPTLGTPPGVGLGGVGAGMGPTGSSMDDSGNDGGVKLGTAIFTSPLLALAISGIMWWWN